MTAAAMKPDIIPADNVGGVSGAKLKNFVERIERMEEEKAGVANDIKDTYSEAKAFGFDAKAMRTLIRIRKQDIEKRREQEEILELYKAALGMAE
jgi:uncharacterized protein (UPF0335 family)